MGLVLKEITVTIENNLYNEDYGPAILLWMIKKSGTAGITADEFSRKIKITTNKVSEYMKKLESEKLVTYFKGIKKISGLPSLCVGYDITEEGETLSDSIDRRFGEKYTSLYDKK